MSISLEIMALDLSAEVVSLNARPSTRVLSMSVMLRTLLGPRTQRRVMRLLSLCRNALPTRKLWSKFAKLKWPMQVQFCFAQVPFELLRSKGRSTLANAQHDTASQVILILKALKDELGLQDVPDPAITVPILADRTATCMGRTDFTLQCLDNGDKFAIFGALVVPYFSDDENILPRAVDVTRLKHFEGVEIPVITNRKRVNILIRPSDKALLTGVEEHEGALDEPNLIFTRLGPAASGGRVHSNCNSLRALWVLTIPADSDCVSCDKLHQALVTAKGALREVQLLDEEVQPSKNYELACKLVEPFVKVVQGRYEMPVPFKSEVLKAFLNNYQSALKRTLSLRGRYQKVQK